MNFKSFSSFDNFNSLLRGYYSLGFLLPLTFKLTIRMIGRGDMVGIKLIRGGGWKILQD